MWPNCIRIENCCAVGALFSLRSSLKRATGESKWVLTRGIPDASSTEPQLARRSQQWANIHPCSQNHFDFSVVDPRGCSYDLQGFRGTTVACLDHVSRRDEEVSLFLFLFYFFSNVFFPAEGASSVSLVTLWFNFCFKLLKKMPPFLFFKLAHLLPHTSSGDLKGNRCKHSLCVPVILGKKNRENYCLIILKSLFNLKEFS